MITIVIQSKDSVLKFVDKDIVIGDTHNIPCTFFSGFIPLLALTLCFAS